MNQFQLISGCPSVCLSVCLSVVRHIYFSFLYVFAFIRHLLFIYHKSFIYPLRDIIFHNNFVPATAAVVAAATSSGQTSWPLATPPPSLIPWRAAACATRMCIGADNKDPSTDWQLEASNFVISHASKSRRWRHQQAHFSFSSSPSLSLSFSSTYFFKSILLLSPLWYIDGVSKLVEGDEFTESKDMFGGYLRDLQCKVVKNLE